MMMMLLFYRICFCCNGTTRQFDLYTIFGFVDDDRPLYGASRTFVLHDFGTVRVFPVV